MAFSGPHPLVRLLLKSLAGRHPMETFTSLPPYSISSAKEKEVTPPTRPISHPLLGVSISFKAPSIQKATRAKERKEKQKTSEGQGIHQMKSMYIAQLEVTRNV